MASSQDRIMQLAEEHLGRAVNLDGTLADSGVSSVYAVAFLKLVSVDVKVPIPPEEAAKFTTLRDLIDYVDSHAG